MPTSFKALAELCEQLTSTKKRLMMVQYAADLLLSLDMNEIEPAVSMILGRAFPKWSQQTLDVSWTTLSGVIKKSTRGDWNALSRAFSQTGDIGDATKALFETGRTKKQSMIFEKSLTILEVRRSLQAIAESRGYGSREKKERLVTSLFSAASPLEAKYLVKIFVSEMRTGFHEGLMEQAVAEAFDVPLKSVQRASMVQGDVGEVAAIVKAHGKQGLVLVNFKVFRPVQLMLAQMADGVEQALQEHEGKTAFEFKYDGARVQIHKLGNEIMIFSRRLTEVTSSIPEIADLAKKNVDAGEAIFEGEVIAVDHSGFPIPFQHLMRRFRRIHSIEEIAGKIPLKLFLFDLLYADGESMIDLPYMERREILARKAGGISLTRQIVTDNASLGKAFLKEAMDGGNEGLMAKRLDSPYTPGIRGKRWLKIKPVLEPLDLVIVAAEYGYGRRHGWLSDYYLAARDVDSGEFLGIGKTFKGLTDAEIVEMTQRLKQIAVSEDSQKVTVVPKIVVEVLYNEVQKSPTYKSGVALRFARIGRIRNDKTPEEADTIQRVREIYEKQFLKKGRYKIN